ncbi:hypothetical protein Nepgr_004916 [Nepenthes gracilis]|uniref:Uncharacterized protein n=1 Tax=Nepenthes gracilis TaxID=150966 RepID=A0AAD3S2I0_NEPGR|nr:hypothetical protein Nepgr_004916 [Nepenthes gracilis]
MEVHKLTHIERPQFRNKPTAMIQQIRQRVRIWFSSTQIIGLRIPGVAMLQPIESGSEEIEIFNSRSVTRATRRSGRLFALNLRGNVSAHDCEQLSVRLVQNFDCDSSEVVEISHGIRVRAMFRHVRCEFHLHPPLFGSIGFVVYSTDLGGNVNGDLREGASMW